MTVDLSSCILDLAQVQQKIENIDRSFFDLQGIVYD